MPNYLQFTFFFLLLLISTFAKAQSFNFSDIYDDPTNRQGQILDAGDYKLKIRTYVKKANGEVVIKGQVLDSATNKPIKGASVDQKGRTEKNAISKRNGDFSIILESAEKSMVIKAEGKNKQELSVPAEPEPAGGKSSGNPQKAEEDLSAKTQLSGILVANFGEESVLQPNVLVSQSWKFGAWGGVEMKLMGLVNNKDTLLEVNGLNLIKPEISKVNFRLSGDFAPFINYKFFRTNFEANFYRQQLNIQKISTDPVEKKDVMSFLLRYGLTCQPVDGLSFSINGVYNNVFNGIENYESRFGTKVWKKYLNAELTGKFYVKNGLLDGSFIQVSYFFNSLRYQEVLSTKDTGNFFIRFGFDKPILEK